MGLHELSEITPKMFISTWWTAKDYNKIKSAGITHILSIYPQAKQIRESHEIILRNQLKTHFVDTGVTYKTITDLNDIFLPEEVEVFHYSISECNEFIHSAMLQENAKILIHCQAGISRSVSMAIVYFLTVFYSIQKSIPKLEKLEALRNGSVVRYTSPSWTHELIQKKRRYASSKFLPALEDFVKSDRLMEENFELKIELDFAKKIYSSLAE